MLFQLKLEEAMMDAREEGLQEGLQAGMERKAIENARNFKKKGVSDEIIAEAIELPIELVRSL